jgi:YD repeat-containing protein
MILFGINYIEPFEYSKVVKFFDILKFHNATGNSFNIHSNFHSLIQDNKKLGDLLQPLTIGQSPELEENHRFKKIEYKYDLISGNVHEVVYQRSKADQFIHHYAYDADNRIVEVQTSKDGLLFDVDARYFYYHHGPLARTELGDNQVQGVDYAYNLQGWIKGINSGALLPENDMGHDSEISAGNPDNPNKFFAKDVASFSLHYFEGDYQKISTNAPDFLPQSTGSYLMTQREDLWNGNIGCMMTNLADPDLADNPQGDKWGMLGMAYRYDQLNRIVSADGFTDYTTSTNIWGTAVESSIYNNAFTYDGNGNILTQKRSDQNSNEFEYLVYQYNNPGGKFLQNRLYHVDENSTVALTAYADDIDDQGTFDPDNLNSINNNYGYTELGELERDNAEHIESIEWRVDSKISYIRWVDNTTTNELAFDYDAMGNRIAKHIYNSNGVYEKSTFYVREALSANNDINPHEYS